jgi:hypothetical protein
MEVAAEEVMLLAAAEKGDLIKLRETIEDYSVPINAIESVSGRTALHYAVRIFTPLHSVCLPPPDLSLYILF